MLHKPWCVGKVNSYWLCEYCASGLACRCVQPLGAACQATPTKEYPTAFHLLQLLCGLILFIYYVFLLKTVFTVPSSYPKPCGPLHSTELKKMKSGAIIRLVSLGLWKL